MDIQRDAETRIGVERVNLKGLTADPTRTIDGDIWYRADLDVLHMNIAGTVFKIVPVAIV